APARSPPAGAGRGGWCLPRPCNARPAPRLRRARVRATPTRSRAAVPARSGVVPCRSIWRTPAWVFPIFARICRFKRNYADRATLPVAALRRALLLTPPMTTTTLVSEAPPPEVPPHLRAARWATRVQFFVLGFSAGIWGVHIPSVKSHYQLGEGMLSVVLL